MNKNYYSNKKISILFPLFNEVYRRNFFLFHFPLDITNKKILFNRFNFSFFFFFFCCSPSYLFTLSIWIFFFFFIILSSPSHSLYFIMPTRVTASALIECAKSNLIRQSCRLTFTMSLSSYFSSPSLCVSLLLPFLFTHFTLYMYICSSHSYTFIHYLNLFEARARRDSNDNYPVVKLDYDA